MNSFQYQTPATLSDAVGLLGEAAPDARVLAGGTDLLIQMRAGAKSPGLLVDIKKIPETNVLELTSQGLRLGAAVSCWDIAKRDDIRHAYPGLMEALELIGSMQIQGRCTVGGNLCNASPAADTTPALIALNAKCLIAGPGGNRTVPVEDFVTGPGTSCLQSGELLVELQIPAPPEHSADAYQRFTPRNEMDIAVVGVATSITLDAQGACLSARVALGAVAAKAILVPAIGERLVGSMLDERTLENAANTASSAASPIDDKRGTADFRREIAGVLTRRTIQAAAERARNLGDN